MKKIKKILFTFVIIIAGFSCKMNVLGDTVCRYKIDYPFESTQTMSDLNVTYNNYINYIYRRILGKSSTEFFQYQENFVSGLTVVSAELSFSLNDFDSEGSVRALISYKYSNKKTHPYQVLVLLHFYEQFSDCPDLVAFYGPKAKKNSLLDGKVDDLVGNFFLEEDEDYSVPLIFMSDAAKIATGGIMYVNYAYNQNFNDVNPSDNIDPIVEKYLAIDGIKEILEKLNEVLDKENINNSDMSGITESIAEFLKKIDINLDTIGNDLRILTNFNSVEIAGVKGIRNILNTYLDDKGLNASTWFGKYMQDSKAQYADSLASVLQYILDNPALYNNVKNNKNLSDTVSSCAGEDCDKEKICNEYVSSLASYECSEQTSISMAYNECYKSKAKNFDKLIKECKKNDIKKITKDIEDLNENIDKLVDETIASYYTRYFKGMGIDIGDNDFCGVLESGDIYEYIKLALNIIRIGGPILVILLTAYDGIKTISSFKDEDNKKFYNHLKVRLICLILLLLIPTIIQFIINLFVDKACNIEIYYK